MVISAVPLLTIQTDAVNSILGLHGERVGRDWWITEPSLRRIGEQTAGGDPQVYFVWGARRPTDRKPTLELAERNEFIEELYKNGVGKSPEELNYYWREFCLHAANWLINKEKPVDMIFIRLLNCPYRANWKSILTQRFRRLGQVLSHRGGTARDYALEQSGFLEELLCPDLLAMNQKHGTCYRHVEVHHCKKWWKLARVAERDRMQQLGNERYAEYFMDSVRRFFKPAMALYTSWLAQIADPCAADCESGHAGRFRFVPNFLRRLHPEGKDFAGLPPVVANKLPRIKPASGLQEDLLAEDGDLSALRDIQPPAKDVRNCVNAGWVSDMGSARR